MPRWSILTGHTKSSSMVRARPQIYPRGASSTHLAESSLRNITIAILISLSSLPSWRLMNFTSPSRYRGSLMYGDLHSGLYSTTVSAGLLFGKKSMNSSSSLVIRYGPTSPLSSFMILTVPQFSVSSLCSSMSALFSISQLSGMRIQPSALPMALPSFSSPAEVTVKITGIHLRKMFSLRMLSFNIVSI